MTSSQKTQTTNDRIQTLREAFERIEVMASKHRVDGINTDGKLSAAISHSQHVQRSGINMALCAVSQMIREAEGRKCKTNS